MNTFQMILSIMAITILTVVALSYNKGSLVTKEIVDYNREMIVATSIAKSMLDEISGKAYDEQIVQGKSIYSANDFSDILKPEAGESYPFFDDIDDYNNFSMIDSSFGSKKYEIMVKINYITDKLKPTINKTYNKNVTVYVTSKHLYDYNNQKQDTVKISSIMSQWTLL